MIVAVTGGTGFIGRKLVARLIERGDTVRLLTRTPDPGEHSSIEVHQCDLLTAEVSELSSILEGVEVLYHCAGQINDLSAMRALHVDATHKLVGAASHRIGRWVQLSSVGVYGPVSEGEVTEDSAISPVGEYEVTKAESDQIIIEAADRGCFGYSMLRPSNVFGAGMQNRSLFDMIRIIDRGLFFYIGKPGASANYIHVDNVAEALLQCGTLPRAEGGIFNLSDCRTLEEFVAIIASALGKHAPRMRLPKAPVRLLARWSEMLPGFPLTEARVDALTNRATYPDTRIERELGYRHLVTMEEGVMELVALWKKSQ
ncbi:MAG: NAD-dependent epimerase/dehydratase family protein [Nitrosomonadales bacterium]|nr:NAD-dependent epimerase/dehydratase family protein [Nitrosomonadales bacterium]